MISLLVGDLVEPLALFSSNFYIVVPSVGRLAFVVLWPKSLSSLGCIGIFIVLVVLKYLHFMEIWNLFSLWKKKSLS